MSQAPNDGGPAFPVASICEFGMSLRDYFAGQALAAMLSIEDVHHKAGESEIAQWAYKQADAMLAVRQMPAESVAEAQQVAVRVFNQNESIGAK